MFCSRECAAARQIVDFVLLLIQAMFCFPGRTQTKKTKKHQAANPAEPFVYQASTDVPQVPLTPPPSILIIGCLILPIAPFPGRKGPSMIGYRKMISSMPSSFPFCPARLRLLCFRLHRVIEALTDSGQPGILVREGVKKIWKKNINKTANRRRSEHRKKQSPQQPTGQTSKQY